MSETAPRVTIEHIEKQIVGEYSGRASDLFEGCPHNGSLETLTICVLVLKNGYTVIGKSACVSPENYNADIGHKIAREDAVRQIWALEGYLLKARIHEDTRF